MTVGRTAYDVLVLMLREKRYFLIAAVMVCVVLAGTIYGIYSMVDECHEIKLFGGQIVFMKPAKDKVGLDNPTGCKSTTYNPGYTTTILCKDGSTASDETRCEDSNAVALPLSQLGLTLLGPFRNPKVNSLDQCALTVTEEIKKVGATAVSAGSLDTKRGALVTSGVLGKSYVQSYCSRGKDNSISVTVLLFAPTEVELNARHSLLSTLFIDWTK